MDYEKEITEIDKVINELKLLRKELICTKNKSEKSFNSNGTIKQKQKVSVDFLKIEDIEILGFVLFKKINEKSVFINESKCSRDEKIYFGERFENKRYIAIENNCGDFYFKGWLENKKELEKLLNQVCVGFNKESNQAVP